MNELELIEEEIWQRLAEERVSYLGCSHCHLVHERLHDLERGDSCPNCGTPKSLLSVMSIKDGNDEPVIINQPVVNRLRELEL